jgi:hypothetical protein
MQNLLDIQLSLSLLHGYLFKDNIPTSYKKCSLKIEVPFTEAKKRCILTNIQLGQYVKP